MDCLNAHIHEESRATTPLLPCTFVWDVYFNKCVQDFTLGTSSVHSRSIEQDLQESDSSPLPSDLAFATSLSAPTFNSAHVISGIHFKLAEGDCFWFNQQTHDTLPGTWNLYLGTIVKVHRFYARYALIHIQYQSHNPFRRETDEGVYWIEQTSLCLTTAQRSLAFQARILNPTFTLLKDN
jgi:hypothetical protein